MWGKRAIVRWAGMYALGLCLVVVEDHWWHGHSWHAAWILGVEVTAAGIVGGFVGWWFPHRRG